jgi:hypothetical protein
VYGHCRVDLDVGHLVVFQIAIVKGIDLDLSRLIGIRVKAPIAYRLRAEAVGNDQRTGEYVLLHVAGRGTPVFLRRDGF